MDDTFADESGIPFLDSNADIPVHSTPIKGGNVPLPSTRHVLKKMVQNTGPGQDLTASESIQSIQLPDSQPLNRDPRELQINRDYRDLQILNRDHRDLKVLSKDNSDENPPQGKKEQGGHYDGKAFMLDRDYGYGQTDKYNAYSSAKLGDDYRYMTEKDNLRPRAREAYQNEYTSDMRGDYKYATRTSDMFDYKADHKYDLTGQRRSDKQTGDIKTDQMSSNVPTYKYLPNSDRDSKTHDQEAALNHKNMNKSDQDQTPKSDYITNKTIINGGSTPDTNHSAYSGYATNTKTWSKQLASYHLSGSWDKPPLPDMNSTPPDQRIRMETVTRVSRDFDDDSVKIDRYKLKIRSPKLSRKKDSQSNKSTSQSKQNSSFCELENSTLHKQRKEIQLLMSELKDRDRELSEMMSSHQQQLLAWEQDRQRLTTMEKKCSQYEADLQTKTSKLHQSLVNLKTLKARDTEQRQELQERRSTLDALRTENQSLQGQLSQEKTSVKHYKDKLESVSAAVGRLEAREEELATNVKLKERDIAAATSQMRDLSERLTQLDLRCKECQDREKEALKEKEDWRRRHEKSETERNTMSDELASSRAEVTRLSEENRSARQQLSLLQKEIGMREKCKDELIDSLKIKQERTDSQLKNIRELYERLLKEVAMLQQQLDTSKEIIHRQQHSIEEQQFSKSYQSRASSHISDSSMEKSTVQKSFQSSRAAKQSPVQSSKYREPDYDMQSSNHQSSGYQSQLSENQTGLVLGNQPTNVHNVSDQSSVVSNKPNQYIVRPVSNDDNYVKSSQPTSEKKNDAQVSDTKFTSNVPRRIVFSEFSPERSSTKQFSYSQPFTISNSQPQKNIESSCKKDTFTGSVFTISNDMIKSTQSQNKDDQLQSPPRRGGFVIQQTHIELYPEQTGSNNSEPVSFSKDTKQEPVQTAGAQREIIHEQMKVNNNETSLSEQDKEDCDKEMAQKYVFENKLTSFLEDIEDIDDSIWDDKSVNITNVEGSPASKLQKLLLESRMMIQSLEKSSESPQHNPNVDKKESQKPNSTEAADTEKQQAT